ncbi:homocysteine S-methyltransferase 1-like isoform X2 [Bufo gargarizans]|uniref:homocysteine S-methyltransferase 1-like isoform X2 n=1 Tax=Bufo gargarizans TaxID=30331 RepID=UPI001CF4919E|nr:homocysteine S-methyltransferase 1-like isoform X2 [Bufo gargarizans]
MTARFPSRGNDTFLRSGAEVLSTATYQASVEGFKQHLGLNSDEAANLFTVAVQQAKESAEDFTRQCSEKRRILIAGSIGPYGAFLHDGSEYTGSYVKDMSIEQLKDWHRIQMKCLAAAGIDLFAFETIPSQKEAEALVQLLREFPNHRAWLSYSCQSASMTSFRERFDDAVSIAAGSTQLMAVGVNCCSPAFVGPLLSSANKKQRQKIDWIVYPNSGEKWDHNLGWQGSNTNKAISEYALEWIQLGARWIGGCCRTTPTDIASIQDVLQTNNS